MTYILTKIDKKDIFFMFGIISSMILATLINNYLPIPEQLRSVLTAFVFILLFIFCLILYSAFLTTEWSEFRATKIHQKLALCVLFFLGIFVILSLTRKLLPTSWLTTTIDQDPDVYTNLSIKSMLFSSIQPLLAPFYEEIMFRYILIKKLPKKQFRFIFLIIQALLFGLIHTFNFGGNPLATVPYMVVALYFGIIYYVSNNIWFSIIPHWLFNFTNSLLPVLIYGIIFLIG